MCPSPTITRSRGFSLVELLVAITIGLFVLAAVVTVLVNSRQNYTVQDSLARLQENARFAVDSITRDLRMSGHFGCSHKALTGTSNQLDIAGLPLFNAGIGLAGLDDMVVGTSEWHSSVTSAADTGDDARIVPGTDAIVTRFMNTNGLPVIAPFMQTPTDPIRVAANNGQLNKGDIVLVADCSNADLFQVTSDNPGTTGIVGHGVGVSGVSPGNIRDSFGPTAKPVQYENETPARLIGFTIARYFVGARRADTGALCLADCRCDTEHVCGLFRIIGGNPAQELVSGIENMQILYGVDTTDRPPPPEVPDYSPDTYVTAENVSCLVRDGGGVCIGWDRVTSLRIGLLAYTLASETDSGEYGRLEDTGTYDVNGKMLRTVDGNLDAKRVKRRVFTTTVALRNLRP